MNKEQLLHIVENPGLTISADHLIQLEELLKIFPYFQGGHVLVAKAYHESGNVFADKKIKKAAIYTGNRKKLKQYISSPSITSLVSPSTPEITEPQPPTLSKELESKPVESSTVTIEPTEKETDTSLNDEIAVQLEKLKSVKKEVAETKDIPVKATKVTKTKKATPAKEKPLPKEKKKPVAKKTTKPTVPKPTKTTTTKKENLSSSRLGDALYETNDRTEQEIQHQASDVLLDYLEHMRSKRRTTKKPVKEQFDIIDSFIEKEPTISRIDIQKAKQESISDLSQHSSIENTKLISENLALIYARQGNIKKAISIYEELILKNPLKKAYFASQIEKLKN